MTKLIYALTFISIISFKFLIDEDNKGTVKVQVYKENTSVPLEDSYINSDGENAPPEYNSPADCTTDTSGSCSFNKDENNYWVKASKDHYRPQEKPVKVKKDQEVNVIFNIYPDDYESYKLAYLEKYSSRKVSKIYCCYSKSCTELFKKHKEELIEYYKIYGDLEKIQKLKLYNIENKKTNQLEWLNKF